MTNKFFSSVFILLSSTSALADHPKENIERWLAKMHSAAHMINYDGDFVYGQDNELTSMQIIHSVDKTGEFEKLISLDGSGREVIRSGNTVTCILPDKKAVVVDKSRPVTEFPPKFPLKISRLTKYYGFHFDREARVAGQNAKKLVITPKDKYRYGHVLWIDSKTGLLLKDHLIGENGQIVELFMFTRINYPDFISRDRISAKNNNNKKFTWYKAKESNPKLNINNSMNWKVMQTPPGFMPDIKRHHEMTVSSMPVEHFVFSDGLSSISVFVEKKMKNSKNLLGGSKMGAVNAYGRSINDYHVTVVGEVPQAAVKMVGDSVKQVNQ